MDVIIVCHPKGCLLSSDILSRSLTMAACLLRYSSRYSAQLRPLIQETEALDSPGFTSAVHVALQAN